MIKSINMDITDENLSKFSEQHKEHEFAILFYDDKFDINKKYFFVKQYFPRCRVG